MPPVGQVPSGLSHGVTLHGDEPLLWDDLPGTFNEPLEKQHALLILLILLVSRPQRPRGLGLSTHEARLFVEVRKLLLILGGRRVGGSVVEKYRF